MNLTDKIKSTFTFFLNDIESSRVDQVAKFGLTYTLNDNEKETIFNKRSDDYRYLWWCDLTKKLINKYAITYPVKIPAITGARMYKRVYLYYFLDIFKPANLIMRVNLRRIPFVGIVKKFCGDFNFLTKDK